MTATNRSNAGAQCGAGAMRRVGQVVSTKMQKTIVVAVEMRKAHAKH